MKVSIVTLMQMTTLGPMMRPKDIQLIGTELAIVWEDGKESYISSQRLRARSPSASVSGERDIFGAQYGGETGKDYSQVTIESWTPVGNYALRFQFSDGHNTGLYSYELLRTLGES